MLAHLDIEVALRADGQRWISPKESASYTTARQGFVDARDRRRVWLALLQDTARVELGVEREQLEDKSTRVVEKRQTRMERVGRQLGRGVHHLPILGAEGGYLKK